MSAATRARRAALRARRAVAALRLAAALIVALGGGCTAAVQPDEPPRGEPFVAIAADFSDFRDWPSFELPPDSLTPAHPSGARRLYFDGVPAAGDPTAPFPVGTILVKAEESGDPTAWEIHAMVKRGGGFNAEGALGWEFFDLAIDAAGEVQVRWRGEGPPLGMGYPGEGTGDGQCNACHALVPDRDFVFDRLLFE